MLELDDDDEVASKEVLDRRVFRPSVTVYFKIRLQIDYLHFWYELQRVNAGAHESIEEQAPRTVRYEDILLPASEFAPPSLTPSPTASDILSGALKTFCRICDCPFQDL